MTAEMNDKNTQDVEILQLGPQPVLSIRETIAVARLGEAVGDRIQTLSDYLRQCGARPAGPPFVLYHTFGDTETDFEFGVPMLTPVEGQGRIASRELPGGPALSTWHEGPHEKLGEAYARIAESLRAHEREPDGPAREVYYWIDLGQREGSVSAPESSIWRTQLLQPIK